MTRAELVQELSLYSASERAAMLDEAGDVPRHSPAVTAMLASFKESTQVLRDIAAEADRRAKAQSGTKVPTDLNASRDIRSAVDLDKEIEEALDRAGVVDGPRRIGAKLEGQRTGRVPSWLPPAPQEISAVSPLTDRVNARLNELNTDPIVRIALKMQAAMEGKEPEILQDAQRMSGLRRRDGRDTS